jgi:UPF0042 nucleotide-binding protein
MLLDVRFLKNPFWQPELKALTGLDKDVGTFIESDEGLAPFITNLKNMLEPLLPRYQHEGKSYFTIALGCTGGKHRSVYTVELLKEWLSQKGYNTHGFHRDIHRRSR